MDLSDPAILFSGLAISLVGIAVFIHGKRTQSLKSLAIGVLMMVYPIFVPSVLWMWVIAGGCGAGLFFLPQDA